jgi:cytochrome c peroxidase
MTLRPPVEIVPIRDDDRAAAELGGKIFRGEAKVAAAVACARCHIPALPLDNTTAVVHDPFTDQEAFGGGQIVSNRTGLSAQVASSADLPVVRRFMALEPAKVVRGKELADAVGSVRKSRSAAESAFFGPGGADRRQGAYAFDLVTLQPANLDPSANAQHAPPLSGSLPRLLSGTAKEVPLLSDLKRHHMGQGLREHDGFQQGTDVAGINVAEDEFLTRPLWGVADTGPWLHDGRAQSLQEAILLHESTGSEANDVIEAFRHLDDADQKAVVAFLLTLRLPLDPRYSFDDYR